MSADAETRSAAKVALEKELVGIFSELAEIFGNPRSLGAIYGVLFASEDSLTMEQIVRQIGISKGSASQGLRQLEDLGAITRHRENGTRNHLYAARLELKPLVSGFLSKKLIPGLTAGAQRVNRLHDLVPALPESFQPAARLRLHRISQWHKRAATFLPLAQKLLQGD